MATETAEERKTRLDEFGAYLDGAGLGPVTSVEEVPFASEPDDEPILVLRVTLDHRSEVVRTLQRWVDLLVVHDVVVGTYGVHDDFTRLNLRGEFASGTLVVVVAPFRRDSAAARFVESRVGSCGAVTLVEVLLHYV